MSFFEFGTTQLRGSKLARLGQQADKFVKTQADILIWGAAGTGKTTWAKRLAARMASSAYRVFEGREFVFEDFFAQLHFDRMEVVLVEDVDQLSFSEQSKLLAWLENPSRKVRIIFTARRNLSALVSQQSFRSDLYFKISVAEIALPEIRDMHEDMSVLINHLFGVSKILHNRSALNISSAAIERLCSWDWPGNFSELENVIEKAVVLCEGQQVELRDIELHVETQMRSLSLPIKKLAEVERDLIIQTLKVTDQNRTKAAEILGISIRTLRNKIHEYRQEGIL